MTVSGPTGGTPAYPPPPAVQGAVDVAGLQAYYAELAETMQAIKDALPLSMAEWAEDKRWLQDQAQQVMDRKKGSVVVANPATLPPAKPPSREVDIRVPLPLHVSKALLQQVRPFTQPGDAVPDPCDLDDWWVLAEQGVMAISPSVDLSDFPPEGIENVGKLLLGPVAWAQITRPPNGWNVGGDGQPIGRGRPSQAWERFRERVNAVFSLTGPQREARFYAMACGGKEGGADFVLRVER